MKRIENVEQALDLLERAVATRGRGYTSSYCAYTSSNGAVPGCLVGVALHMHGWTLLKLKQINNEAIHDVARRNADMFGPGVATVFQAAQRLQDTGLSWGRALDAARIAAGLTTLDAARIAAGLTTPETERIEIETPQPLTVPLPIEKPAQPVPAAPVEEPELIPA